MTPLPDLTAGQVQPAFGRVDVLTACVMLVEVMQE